jgi:PhnB protein
MRRFSRRLTRQRSGILTPDIFLRLRGHQRSAGVSPTEGVLNAVKIGETSPHRWKGLSLMKEWIPNGWHSVTPRLVARDAAALVEFLRRAFDATGAFNEDRPSEMTIGDSVVMVSDGGGVREAMPAFLYLYVPDVERTFARAIEAGAVEREAPRDVPYGDRRAMIEDPSGNVWQIATRISRA